MKRTALLSVWDKEGLVPLARRLHQAGWELIASGGTAREIEKAGLDVTPVEAITGEPPLFQGRVKTLHPAIHAGILAPDTPEARGQLREKGWPKIDLVAVNLYPFRKMREEKDLAREQLIEFIDIGGAALLRAAAKNYRRVSALCDPGDYPEDLAVLEDENFREKLAAKVFTVTAAYDASISRCFESGGDGEDNACTRVLTLHPALELRYGENPHQPAAFYAVRPGGSPLGGRLLAGKALSYNNLLDVESAWRAVQRFRRPAVVVAKHTSPCGVAAAETAAQALPLAVASDPVSAFGSVIAVNRKVDGEFVRTLEDLFVECLAAPGFTDQARGLLVDRENLRLLGIPPVDPPSGELRSIPGGYLFQSTDRGDPPGKADWRVVTDRQPTARENAILRFAWKAIMDVKSNAVLLADQDGDSTFTVGIGGGQPNRVDCVRLAGKRAEERSMGSVLASDAFFPFPDGIRLAGELGVTAVVQPGGSIRDREVIQEANRQEMALVFTGTRHFRH